MSFNWKELLGVVAPVIGTAIGGPFGALAGTAVKVALGLPEDTDEQTMAKAMEKATPDQLLALKNAEQQFKLDMEKLGVDKDRIEAADRASAREREINLKDHTPAVLAGGVTCGFFGILTFMCGWQVPDENLQMLNIMLGSLGAAWISIVSYYFGTSAGSREKNRMFLNYSAK
jgi:hypothetical protein